MKILISNSSDLPLYQQIKEQLKDAILQGDLKDGDLSLIHIFHTVPQLTFHHVSLFPVS